MLKKVSLSLFWATACVLPALHADAGVEIEYSTPQESNLLAGKGIFPDEPDGGDAMDVLGGLPEEFSCDPKVETGAPLPDNTPATKSTPGSQKGEFPPNASQQRSSPSDSKPFMPQPETKSNDPNAGKEWFPPSN